ncbi:3'-5' exonuclease [Sulfurospirillum diekertiae]|uniref:3'-5' exonuclease n=1 Tax=Sulfurospirillum diekertiae TaxID=1854492 RepID=A0A290HTS4_9BACT|nr:3'-5' exonuclease [Sulfurospirillum diekertiae]ATB69226.1 DNA polymerase III epsilon subunit [Sulfurospirillum diekertiae]QIR76875.1 3'-5' exonuclease [Sulfurospirillum diekertiae]QIR79493.1 3'-5' exonuclease [Sulfurospirillum diekertiae]
MFASFFAKRNAKKLKDEQYRFLFDEAPVDEVVVFDTETTGLSPKKDEILSIGAVKIKGNKILMSEKFELFIKPSREINEKSIKIHQIRNVDLEHGIAPHEAIVQFLHFIGSRPLVGYYLEFDIKMMNTYVKPWLGINLPNPQIEVSGLYHDKKIKFIPDGVIDLRFDVMMNDLGLPIFGKHDALNDAVMTAMMYIKLQNIGKI